MALRRDQSTLLSAGLVSVLLWVVPILRWVALPLIYLNTHIHELCHAVTAIATGGHPLYISVFADGSGVTPVEGSLMLLTASAGYTGTALIGGLLIAVSRKESSARTMVWLTFACMLLSLVVFVRGDAVGIFSAVFWVLALGWMGARLKGQNIVFAAQFLGLQMALTSIQSFLALIQVTTSLERHSDALILEQASGIPSIVWAVGWMIFGVFCIGFGLWSAWQPEARKRSSA